MKQNRPPFPPHPFYHSWSEIYKGKIPSRPSPGEAAGSAGERVEKMGLGSLGFEFKSYPSTYWDVYQKNGLTVDRFFWFMLYCQKTQVFT